MASEFEEIAKETVQQCDALSAIASEAWKAMTDLDGLTGDITDEIETALADMRSRMRSLVSDAAAARNRTEGAAASVETALTQLLGSVRDTLRDQGREAARVVAAAQRVRALPEEPTTVLTEFAPLMDRGVAGVDAAVERLTRLLASESDKAMTGLKSAAAALQAAHSSLDQGVTEWTQRLDALTVGAGQQMGALLHDLALAADEHARGTVEALNGAVPAHNALIPQLTTLLGITTMAELTPSITALHDRETSLDAAIDERNDVLTASVTAIGEAAIEVAGELDEVAAGLGVLAGIGTPG